MSQATPTHLNRRKLLTLSAGLAVPLTALPTGTFERTLDLENPVDALTAMVKMRASLEAEDSPNWYFGTIYGVLPGQAPIPMVDYEGSEIDYFERQPDGSYYAYSATVSFFRDTRTRQLLTTFNNPITGKLNEVQANNIKVKAHYIYSIYGSKRSDDPRPLSKTPVIGEQIKWTESGEFIWMNTRRPYPPGMQMGEDQTFQALTKDLHDPSRSKVMATAMPTYIAPWLRWMDMAGHPGHTVWVGPARKVNSVTEYPRALLDFISKYYPEKLTAKPAS